jgi:putative flippase GtrA
MTSTSLAPSDLATTSGAVPVLDIVVPVHDEERDLGPSVRRLHSFVQDSLPFACRITIADNASTDRTWEVAEELAATLTGVRAVHLAQKGRGRALRAAWSGNDATVLAYMDVDLSTDLTALLPLVAPVISGHSDVAIGTRLSRSARVVRGTKRELISRCYNTLLHATLGTRFSDAQCGFKAIRAECAEALLPLVEDTEWFFDTELLVLAERAGLRIHEVPVDWVDDVDSRVDVVATAVGDLKGIARLGRRLVSRQLPLETLRAQLHGNTTAAPAPGLSAQVLRFAAIGVLSTLAYLLLYVASRSVVSAQAANAVALLLTAVANTAANRRWTFGVRGPALAMRHQAQGLVVLGAALLLTSASLAALHAAAPHASRGAEIFVLVLANLTATALRFTALRVWVFRSRSSV